MSWQEDREKQRKEQEYWDNEYPFLGVLDKWTLCEIGPRVIGADWENMRTYRIRLGAFRRGLVLEAHRHLGPQELIQTVWDKLKEDPERYHTEELKEREAWRCRLCHPAPDYQRDDWDERWVHRYTDPIHDLVYGTHHGPQPKVPLPEVEVTELQIKEQVVIRFRGTHCDPTCPELEGPRCRHFQLALVGLVVNNKTRYLRPEPCLRAKKWKPRRKVRPTQAAPGPVQPLWLDLED